MNTNHILPKKDVSIEYLFSRYIENTCNNIDHPELIEHWNYNMYKAEYESNLDNHFFKHSKKRELNQRASEEYWPARICDKIIWFLFQGVMVHA